MTLSVGNVVAKLGPDGKPVEGEMAREFQVVAMGSLYGPTVTTAEGTPVWGTRMIVELKEVK